MQATEINSALLHRADELVTALYPERPAIITSREIRLGRRGSLAVDRRKGLFYDHSADTGGDMLALIQYARCCGFSAALAWAESFLGSSIHPAKHSAYTAPVKEQEQDKQRMEKARLIWRECSAVGGTLAERYLREHRGITIALPPSLRFHPRLPYVRDPRQHFPAMVAAVQDVSRAIIGIQATYLSPKTANKITLKNMPARLSVGAVKGGTVRLAHALEKLVIAEGVEDALSIMQSCPEEIAWATLGTSGLRGARLPETVREVIIAADNDAAGREAAQALKTRLQVEGRKVAVIYPRQPYKDFNDELRGTI